VSLLLTTWTITAPAPDLPSHREEGREFGFVLVARKIKELCFLIVIASALNFSFSHLLAGSDGEYF
jgi:hypothetical protein